MNAHLPHHRRPLVIAITACFALTAIAPSAYAAYDNVLNCNDTGSGSLRATVASAANGDTIILNPVTMQYSSITLGSGEIVVPQNDLTIKYNGDNTNQFAISGSLHDRVFDHSGSGTLHLNRLHVLDGKYDNTNISQLVHANGGCIYSRGSVYLLDSAVTGCVARDTRGEDAAGGGIYASGNVTLLHSAVSGNSATSTVRFADGGGVFAHGALSARYSTIGNNSVSGTGRVNSGGGIAIVSAPGARSTLAYSTIAGNRADRGGGLFVAGFGTGGALIAIANSTISGNVATDFGGAVDLRGPVTIDASTIAFNSSPSGTAQVVFESPNYSVRITSSIVANNTGNGIEYDIGGGGTMTITGQSDLIMVASRAITLPAQTLTVDPLLLPLANNGGPTQTHAFRDGSPAFGHGDNGANLATDQRGQGYARTINGATDIGAFQQQVRDVIFANGFD